MIIRIKSRKLCCIFLGYQKLEIVNMDKLLRYVIENLLYVNEIWLLE